MKLKLNPEKIANLCQKTGISYLALFGSYARGEEKEGSDVDLLVKYAPDSNIKSLLDHVGVQIEFEDIFQKKVDLVEKAYLKPKLKSFVLSDLLVLYER